MNATERLRVGQANIDRMKREVEQTVNAVLGVVRRDRYFFPYAPYVGGYPRGKRIFANGLFQWVIAEDGMQSVRAEGWHLFAVDGGSSSSLVYSSGDARFPRLEFVFLVHRALPLLVDSALRYQCIADALRPILDAADYQF